MSRPTSFAALVRPAVLLLLALTFATVVSAQPDQPDLTIDAATRTQVIDGILKRLNDS